MLELRESSRSITLGQSMFYAMECVRTACGKCPQLQGLKWLDVKIHATPIRSIRNQVEITAQERRSVGVPIRNRVERFFNFKIRIRGTDSLVVILKARCRLWRFRGKDYNGNSLNNHPWTPHFVELEWGKDCFWYEENL